MAHVVVFDGGKQDMSTFIGSIVSKIIDRHPSKTPRLLFPTGSTPLGPDGYFAALINLRKNHSVKTEGIRLVSGDEYHGIKPSNPGSFMGVLQEGKQTLTFDYSKVNEIIREILCSKGSCPVY